MPPLVSILIPCHNAALWLADTVESALAQTWPRIEVIVVDNGSTDESAAIARKFAARGVRLLTETRRGASAARNTALAAAAGDYIQYLDADDLLTPDKIEAQIGLLFRDECHSAVASCRWGRFVDDPKATIFADDSVFRDFAPIEFLLQHARAGHMMHPAAWLVPRGVIKQAGPWDESLSLNDDGEYFCRVLLCATGILFSATGASLYRSHLPLSLSRRRDRAALDSLFRSVELVSAHLEDTGAPQTRPALADYWQRLSYELYPEAPELSRRAARIANDHGGSRLRPPLGNRQRWLARFVGWRLTRRFSQWLAR